MHRWLNASVPAAAQVADRSVLWLPGALAWMVTVGWLALVLGVARPPTVAELTFLGAGAVTSGQWPWNAVGILAVVLVMTGIAISLASAAEAVLLHGRRAGFITVTRIALVGVVCVAPLALAVAAFLVALSIVAPGEFNAPDAGSGGPVLRTMIALGPFIAAILVAGAVGGAVHAAAIRSAADPDDAWSGLHAAPDGLARAGSAAVVLALALLAARIGYVALVVILLRVLWAPIDARLADDGFGFAAVLLLVGFVAIWLCLVLAGGALHAWGSVSWTRLLDARDREAGAVANMESRSRL
jgi:hypothetical protein